MQQAFSPDQFQGYTRAGGPPGVRNHVLLLSLSGLENAAARALHRLFPTTILAGSTYGRGHVGEDQVFQRHMMQALATHPNIGACLVLGPDEKLVAEVGRALDDAQRPWAGLSLQGAREDHFEFLNRAARETARLLHRTSRQPRVPVQISQLAIAIECGHSDATSGIVSNPLAGAFSVLLVAAGGRAVFSETLEWTGTGDVLAARAATPEVAKDIRNALARRHATAVAAGHDVQEGNPGPQNHAGGITTLEEKSLGAIAKGGNQPIAGLLREGAGLPSASGLYLMDTPCLSPESITSMVASGAQLVMFTTGQGNPYGSALAPTIKISANPATVERLGEQIDFDASAVMAGQASVADLVPELRALVMKIASGAMTWSEVCGETTESISRLGPSI